MSQKSNTKGRQPSLLIDSEVARQIRQHAHSSTKAEICGVLIGQDRDGVVQVEASITGLNAEEAGAHVTFTQDTWEHIYKVKDKEFPNARIVGWYHSHPGFGVFLSEHDTFIHRNFFSSPGQVAWVVDPLSDEEGCFGWVSGRIERLNQIAVVDRRGGERAEEDRRPEPTPSDRNHDDADVNIEYQPKLVHTSSESSDADSLLQLVSTIFSHITAILAGFVLAWYLFPRIEILPVPVDPMTGQPLMAAPNSPGAATGHGGTAAGANQRGGDTDRNSSKTDQGGSHAKGDHAQPK